MSSSVLFPTPITLVGSVLNPYVVKFADNQQGGVQAIYGQEGEALVNQLKGQYAQGSLRGALYTATAAAVTVPVNANGLVSVFAILNPVASGVNLELVQLDATSVLAATIVDAIGVYFSTVTQTASATLTTQGTVRSSFVGGPGGKGQFWSALTHSGTPTLQTVCGGWGATTSVTADDAVHYPFQGTVIVPQGVVMSIAMSTAASTASGITLGLSWLEYAA